MSRFINWLTGIGRRQADRELDAIARELFEQLQRMPEQSDPKPLTDHMVRGALAKRREPSDAELQQLRARVSALTKQQREVLKLSAIDRLTYRQIAARLGIPAHVALRELSAAMHALALPRPHR